MKKWMKRLTAIGLAVMMCMQLSACSNKAGGNSGPECGRISGPHKRGSGQ